MSGPGETDSRDARWNDPARFLQELRELRDHAGLGHAELAARAHYPCDVIRAAEAGPSLPDLPVLSAYVRGCGGTFAEWEERWRSLTGCPASPLLPARPSGCSAAASAGARVGATSAAADGHDPALVIAALNRVAEGMATSATSPSLSASSPHGAASCQPGSVAAAEPAGYPGASAAPALTAATPAPDSGPAITNVAAVAAGGPAAADGRRTPAPSGVPPSPSDVPPTPTGVPPTPTGVAPAAVSRVPAHGSRRTLPPRVVLAALIALALVVIAGVVALVS